jgi:murein DD-endopeptidase MepM/ murein hydrolase activator NlpD
MNPSTPLVALLLLTVIAPLSPAAPSSIKPLVTVVDLDVDEEQRVILSDQSVARVKLVGLNEIRDPIRQAVRRAEVSLLLNGQEVALPSGMYHLPRTVGKVQVDCSATSGLNSNGTPAFWGLDKAVRIRLWPVGSPLIRPGSFAYPVKQRWFATGTWFDNEPVDGGSSILPKIYYHSGLDIGGAEALTEVVAATDGLVVSTAGKVLEGHESKDGNSPVAERYDLVYLLDDRGWYYRYSHLDRIDSSIKLGARVKKGDPIGLLGKEGASGGWSHLHFEIKARQPSGKWGTQAGYGFLRQAYIDQYRPKLLANARPGMLLMQGDSTVLDGSRSWVAKGSIVKYEWRFSDGGKAEGAKVEHRYPEPGCFQEILKITDDAGNVDYDFVSIRVVSKKTPELYPHSMHASYWPTFGIEPRDAVTFKVRSYLSSPTPGDGSDEIWDFGDGSEKVKVHSDGNHDQRALNGYAVTQHRYEKPGHYVATVSRKFSNGQTANYHLQVRVGED